MVTAAEGASGTGALVGIPTTTVQGWPSGGDVMRRPFDRVHGPNALLSATGVEFAVVVAVVMLKIMNIVEMFVSVLVAVAVFAASAIALLNGSLRARRLRPSLVTVDVAVGVAVLLAAPTFAPRAT